MNTQLAAAVSFAVMFLTVRRHVRVCLFPARGIVMVESPER
jgi:hypothetical protein